MASIKNDFSDKACFIRRKDSKSREMSVFRREFSARDFKSVYLLCSASTYLECFINGKRALRFCERSYLFDRSYNRVDITKTVKDGRNIVSVLSDETGSDTPSGFICEIAVIHGNGKEERIFSDETWKCRQYRAKTSSCDFFLSGGEEKTDISLCDIQSVSSENYDDSSWENSEKSPCYPDSMHESLTGPQDEEIIYADNAVSAYTVSEKKTASFRFSPLPKTSALCLTNIFSEKETTLKITFTYGSAKKMSFDGIPLLPETKAPVSAGTHTLCAVIGGDTEFYAETDASFVSPVKGETEWISASLPPMPQSAYPWNFRRPDDTESELEKNVLSSHDFSGLSSETKAAFSDMRSQTNSIYHSLAAREYEPVCINEFKNKNIPVPAHKAGKGTCIIFDLGRECLGNVIIDADAPDGTVFETETFELLKDGVPSRIGKKNVSQVKWSGGRKAFESLMRRGFRYIAVTVYGNSSPATIYSVGANEIRRKVRDYPLFECDDEGLNAIYKISCLTAKVCMPDFYVDCPGYEQNVWTGDAGVTGMINLLNFGDFDFDFNYLRLIGQSVDDGVRKYYRTNNPVFVAKKNLPCGVFPTYPATGLPLWSYIWLLHVYNHYTVTGDKKALSDLFPAVMETLSRSYAQTDSRGLLEIDGAWNLIEWANNDIPPYGEITANNMILSYCFEKAAFLSSELGNDTLSAEYILKADEYRSAINKYCYDEKLGAYVDTPRDEYSYKLYLEFCGKRGISPVPYGEYTEYTRVSVQTNTFAVLYGCASGERLERAGALIEKCTRDGIKIAGTPAKRADGAPSEEEAPGGIVRVGSPFFYFFLLGALYKSGMGKTAEEAIKRDYSEIISSGYTTCPETFGASSRSAAHAWSGSPAIYLISDILGIKPLKPGYKEFTVKPADSSLQHAKGSVPTPYGRIFAEWKKNADGSFDIKCEVPEECRFIK